MKAAGSKLVIVGAGMVGSAILNNALTLGLLSEIVVVNRNADKALGEAMDASHTTSFAYSPNVKVRAGTWADCADAQVVVIAAGPSLKPGAASDRNALLRDNVAVVGEVMTEVASRTKDAVVIVVTNPVDVVTYVAQNLFDYPTDRIMGTGTLLDTARLRRSIALRYGVDTKNVHGYILGEHGATAFAAWSLVNIAGVPLDDLDRVFGAEKPFDREAVLDEVKKAGFEILRLKGFTSSGVSMSVCRIIKAVILDEQSILPVSTTLAGEYGISDVALSIPCVVAGEGIVRRIEVPLAADETARLRASAESLRSVIAGLGIR
jgi:L-lactate dehydrogenase